MHLLPLRLEKGWYSFFDISMGTNGDSNSPKTSFLEGKNNSYNSLSDNDNTSSAHLEEKRASSYFPLQIDPIPPTTPAKNLCYNDRMQQQEIPAAKTRSERILETINKRAPPRIIRRILKCSFAYFISTLFSTIYPVAIQLGNVPFITSTGCLLCHPGRTMGAQFDATLTAALGAALAIIYGLAGVAAASTYNANYPDSYSGAAINCIFLVVGVFVAQLLRQIFPKLSIFSLQFMIVQLFTLTTSVNMKEIPMDLSSEFGFCLIIGNFISLIVNLFIWPETAVDGLGRALNQTLYDSKEMLDVIARQFFLDPKSDQIPAKTVDELTDKMHTGVSKVNTAYREAKYEASYAYSSSADLNQTRNALYRITKHLCILGETLKKQQNLIKNADIFTFRNDYSNSEDNEEEGNDGAGSSGGERSAETPDNQQGDLNHNFHTKRDSLRQSALEATARYWENGEFSTAPNGKDAETEGTLHTSNTTTSLPALGSKVNNDEEVNVHFEQSAFESKNSSSRAAKRLSQCSNISEKDKSKSNGKRKSHLSSIWSSFTDSPTTRRNSVDVSSEYASEGELDHSESNQISVSSFKSFLKQTGLSATKPKVPEKVGKKMGSKERRLLEIYLETLRDPLLSLVVECASVLDCVHDSLVDQLDLPYEDDANVSKNGVWRYILHVLKLKMIRNKDSKKKKRGADFLCNCAEKMRLQIIEFDHCERNRLKALYDLNIIHMKGNALNNEIREGLFLVFFFIFSMREIALELEEMAQNMRDLQMKTQTEINSNPNQTKKRKKFYMPQITIQTWRKWVHSNSHQNVKDRGGYTYHYLYSNMPRESAPKNALDEYELTQYKKNDNSSIASSMSSDVRGEEHNPGDNATLKKRETATGNLGDKDDRAFELESGIPVNEKNQEKKVPPLLRFRYKLWLCVRYVQGYDFKFALKMCFAVGILTLPVYIPGYYEWYNAIRGQWAALTVIMVMSPTSGGTLSSGLWRLVGTLVGAFTAWAIMEIDDSTAYLLSGFSFFFALPSFYIHFSTSYSKVAIIVLTTYIVIGFGQYLTPNYYETISERVWLRTATLVVGLVTALILNWMVWPFIARDAVRKNLGSTIGDLGDYYSYVMGTFLYHDEMVPPTEGDYKKAIKIEKKMEKILDTCNELLKLTDHEPRLKGPFPKEFYRSILASTHSLLDCMISLRVALMKMTPEVKKAVRNLDKNRHRRDMVASILLHFYTLSSSLKAKIPLPSYMPSARNARAKLLRHRHHEDRPEMLLRYGNLTWSAMACATEEIIDELEHLTDLVRFIVGESKFSYMARRLEDPE